MSLSGPQVDMDDSSSGNNPSVEVIHRPHCSPGKRTCRLSVLGCTYEGTQHDLEGHETLESHMNFILTYTEKANGSMETLRQALTESTQQNLELQSSLNAIKEQMTNMLREQHILQEQVRLLASRVHDSQLECRRSSENMDVRLEEMLSRSWSQGKFVWYIKPYSVLRRQQENGEIARVVSAPFYTAAPGYKLRLMADLNGYGEGRGSHLSLFLQVMQGKFDCVLDWPCKYEHVLRVVDQTGRGLHVDRQQSFRSIPSRSKHLMGRPVTECNVPIGFHTMAPLSELHNERSGFLRNDTLVIVYRCRI
ncbi:TNF receptor-associated factor 5 [Rhipicephalus sanguineus]|uniref:TNF receptor-associated factor 5 n=1 Tax=Rhipicephalus sanguineus TaxID=34632 RepID=UPI0018939CE5|nr:TNF receptor-associated factor 5 [Rhipicephalus sanguineus]